MSLRRPRGEAERGQGCGPEGDLHQHGDRDSLAIHRRLLWVFSGVQWVGWAVDELVLQYIWSRIVFM